MAALLDIPWQGAFFSPATPLDIATIEAAIVDRLASMVSTIEVVHFPDAPASYRLSHRTGAALVTYRGAKYGPVTDTAAIVQERRLEFDVTLLIRDLGRSVGGPAAGARPGAYSLLEAVRGALTGFQVPGTRKMYPVSEKFLERDPQGGVWMYVIGFVLSTLALERSSSDGFPLFVKGIAEETAGETIVTVGASPFTFSAQDEIQLPNVNIIGATLSALDATAYAEGTDYTLDRVNGVIMRIPSGSIVAGATVEIAWSYADVAIASAEPGQSLPIS
jgi:hypothetical protein